MRSLTMRDYDRVTRPHATLPRATRPRTHPRDLITRTLTTRNFDQPQLDHVQMPHVPPLSNRLLPGDSSNRPALTLLGEGALPAPLEKVRHLVLRYR